MANDDSAMPAIAKEFGKKKRANRSAKLKRCKLDARREQWLSQANKAHEDENTPAPASPHHHTSPKKTTEPKQKPKDPTNLENDNSTPPTQTHNSEQEGTIDISFTTSSSGSSIGSEEEEENGPDDWETIADALTTSPHNDDRLLEDEFAPDPTVCRAWRSDDVLRPRNLPNLMKRIDAVACLICYEDLDPTDMAFMPCDCGFRLCLFCHKRIVEEDARCPGCRKQYDARGIFGIEDVKGVLV